MCPELREKSCGIAGIEPAKVECVGEYCCLSTDWDECAVYVSQFFTHSNEAPD